METSNDATIIKGYIVKKVPIACASLLPAVASMIIMKIISGNMMTIEQPTRISMASREFTKTSKPLNNVSNRTCMPFMRYRKHR